MIYVNFYLIGKARIALRIYQPKKYSAALQYDVGYNPIIIDEYNNITSINQDIT